MSDRIDPKTEARVQELRVKAIELKRAGDLYGSRNANIQAIKLDPHRNSLYYNLAKVCYLLNDAKATISNYLRALHLEIYSTAKPCREAKGIVTLSINGSPAYVALTTFENMISPDFLVLMNKAHPDAKFMAADHTNSLHLGHNEISKMRFTSLKNFSFK
jgi:tetratricopeptide (TPR) repeat protein